MHRVFTTPLSPSQNDTIRLLWAYHPDDPFDPEAPRPRLHYHGAHRRGARSAFLLGRGRDMAPPPPAPYGLPQYSR